MCMEQLLSVKYRRIFDIYSTYSVPKTYPTMYAEAECIFTAWKIMQACIRWVFEGFDLQLSVTELLQ